MLLDLTKEEKENFAVIHEQQRRRIFECALLAVASTPGLSKFPTDAAGKYARRILRDFDDAFPRSVDVTINRDGLT